MKYVDEYREPHLVRKLSEDLHKITTRPWTIMEVCGGQTHAIVKFGLQDLLPPNIRLIHGPGCPVCVTAVHLIDHALHIAAQPNTILCSFGDMLRVPGSSGNLLTMKAKGADIRIVYSPAQCIDIAKQNPNRQVVFFAVGFETTAPANAMAPFQAKLQNIDNFSMLCAHVLVLPAMQQLIQSPEHEIQGFLAAGHVCTITGYAAYHALAARYQIPIVVTGFEPVDILQGLVFCVKELENKEFGVINQYQRSVQEMGNLAAQTMMHRVFKVVEREWRGIGLIPLSGLQLNDEYVRFDAAVRFPMPHPCQCKNNGCISGLILQGKKKPYECPLFGKECIPEHPAGAPMVSTEGTCAAYYSYSRF